MKTNIMKIGAALLAMGLCALCTEARAQTTMTTRRGAFTQFVPSTETLVVRSDANPSPLRYVVTKQTTVVDVSGAPVAIDQITPGVPLSVHYTTVGDRLVASRVVVQRPLIEEHATTTTTTTRPLTHDEKEAIEEQREHRKDAMKEEIERRQDALEKAKDALDDDDGH
ncbi:MAG TPA: hypothetical protein VGI85_01515 [Chthoniobacterales bacterium]|jgi:hypothetical protein